MALRATFGAARSTATERHSRQSEIEAALRRVGSPAIRRSPPPEGRLGAGEDYGIRLSVTLSDLGPVFAGFGRYLATRFDLLPRRTRDELDAIPDEGDALSPAAVDETMRQQLGAAASRIFFEFHHEPFAVALWTQRHAAWLSPGIPVTVTVVRPDAALRVEADVPHLRLLAPWLGIDDDPLADAIVDYAETLRRRLDQRVMASAFASLAADAREGGGFAAPVCYRDQCSTNILTIERVSGESLGDRPSAGQVFARQIATAWLRQAFVGSIVPYDFSASDIVVAGERLVLTGGAFEQHGYVERARFASYLSAVAGDNPDAAANWILDGPAPPLPIEILLRRMLRQAVPFRDGEWSGDERLSEHVFVQWRVAAEAGWPVSAHHQHLLRGLFSLARVTQGLGADEDTLLRALEDERLRIGLRQAGELLDPRGWEGTLDRAVQQLVLLPDRLDEVLTRAAEGRLRTKLQVPEAAETEETRNRTVLLVTTVVAFAAMASIVRHLEPAFGSGVERIGALLLLILGGWLLIAAARL